MRLITTTICGGEVSRLWPVSRELHPKPFIRLSDGQSLLPKTLLRSAQLPGIAEDLTAIVRELFFKTEDDFREMNAACSATSFILKPFGRDTATAITAAALEVVPKYGKDAGMLAANHLIAVQQAFQQAVLKAAELAAADKLVTFGIQPISPETNYGYIKADDNMMLRIFEILRLKGHRASSRLGGSCGIPGSSVSLPTPHRNRWNDIVRGFFPPLKLASGHHDPSKARALRSLNSIPTRSAVFPITPSIMP